MRIPLTLVLSLAASHANAFEAFLGYHGSRAMGMAGVFTAQADDSSAILYNPAGLNRVKLAHDISMEYAAMPVVDAQDRLSSDTKLRFAGWTLNEPLPVLIAGTKPGFGLAATELFNLPLNLSCDFFDCADILPKRVAFGRVNIKYRQLTAMINGRAYRNLYWGLAVNQVQAQPDCLTHVSCRNDSRSAPSSAVSLHYDLALSRRSNMALAVSWLTPARLGGGNILSKHIPDTPQRQTLALHYSYGFSNAVLNINSQFEQSSWRAKDDYNSVDYQSAGIGAELLIPVARHSFAIRGGLRKSNPSDVPADTVYFPAVSLLSGGLGYSFANYFLDTAYETRRFWFDAGIQQQQLLSLSLSVQF